MIVDDLVFSHSRVYVVSDISWLVVFVQAQRPRIPGVSTIEAGRSSSLPLERSVR